jgi:hypothetical protein
MAICVFRISDETQGGIKNVVTPQEIVPLARMTLISAGVDVICFWSLALNQQRLHRMPLECIFSLTSRRWQNNGTVNFA